MPSIVVLVVGLALGVPAAPTQAQAPAAAAQCFFPRQIQNYTVSDDERTVYLGLGGGRVYKLSLDGQCLGLGQRSHIALRSAHGDLTICQANEVDLRVVDRGSDTRCTVFDLQPMTPQEVAALPKADRP